METSSLSISSQSNAHIKAGNDRLWDVSMKLEASFIAEMLKSAGLNAMSGEFSGGTGEDQYASFLREAQAEKIAQSGGIGLAESIFNSLQERVSK